MSTSQENPHTYQTPQDQPSNQDQPLNSAEPIREDNRLRNGILVVVVIVVIALVSFFGIRAANKSKEAAPKGSQANPVVIGVVGAKNPHWKAFKAEAEKAGIYVTLRNFTDYTSENPALAQGKLDLNEFQHILYLANYNVKNKQDLQPIGGFAVFPLGLYSTQYQSLKEIPQGARVAIPNDETNQARAIGVLQASGLVKLKGKWTAFTTPRDIDASASRVSVFPLDAAQVANQVKAKQVASGVINNDYVKDSGLSTSNALFRDSATTPSAKPYINVWVSRKEDVNNPVYRKLVKIFHSPAVRAAVRQQFGQDVAFNDDSAEDLQKILKSVESEAR